MASNPFVFGNPVAPEQFIDRQRELRRLKNRVLGSQSTAIVGEPRSGKTSLLEYLCAPETRTDLYGVNGEQMLFSYLDAQAFGTEFSQSQFWERALDSLHERAVASCPKSPLAKEYEVCKENGFSTFVLQRLFIRARAEGLCLVLLLDEFDTFLHHRVLNSAEFFGSLRALASLSRGALALIIACRHSLTTLQNQTQQFSCTGSPYFNFLSEITLGPLTSKGIGELLKRAKGRFKPQDRLFVTGMAGGHPYLLQVGASALWEAYEDGESDPAKRRQQACESLFAAAESTMSDTWRHWSPAMRKAFIAVALDQDPKLVKQHEFHVDQFVNDLSNLGPELRELKKRGFVAEDATVPGGWLVRPRVFLYWLADELTRTVRGEITFEDWLLEQEWEDLLTKGEKRKLKQVINTVGDWLKDVIEPLIEGVGKGAGEGIAKRVVG